MNKFSTQLLALALLLFAGTTAQAQFEVLWGGPDNPNSTFDGGLNDWMTPPGMDANGVSDSAVWVWKADATASEGAYWGNRGPINSPTFDDGAAVFNSDFYDTRGIAGNFGNGPAPAPHSGEMISPAIDLTGETQLALKFNQYFRQFESRTSVAYSNDGGVTFSDAIEVNADIDVNASTTDSSELIVYLPADAGDTDQFHVKFIFETTNRAFYFWIVDDVQIIRAPNTDLALGDFLYPLASYAQPQSQISTDTIVPLVEVSSFGLQEQSDFTVYFRIFDVVDGATDEVQYEDSLVVAEALPQDSTVVLAFENAYSPGDLDIGFYAFEFEVAPNGGVDPDANPSDNSFFGTFEVTENLFAKGDGPGGGGSKTAAGAADYTVANEYQMSSASAAEYKVDSVFSAVVVNATDFPDGVPDEDITIILAALDDDLFVDEGDNSAWFENPGLELVGQGTINFGAFDEGTLVGAPISDINDPAESVMLENGRNYLLMMLMEEEPANLMFTATSDPLNLSGATLGNPATIWYRYANTDWVFFSGNPIAVLQMTISEEEVNTTELDAANLFSVTPNPASDVIRVSTELVETATEATITVVNMDGRVLRMQNYTNLQQDVSTIDISNLAAGNYFVRLATPNGVRTEKIVVVK